MLSLTLTASLLGLGSKYPISLGLKCVGLVAIGTLPLLALLLLSDVLGPYY